MANAEEGSAAPPRSHRIAWLTVTISMGLFISLLLAIPLAPDFLAAASIGGITRGHLLVLLIHIPPVAAAWLYIYKGPEPKQ